MEILKCMLKTEPAGNVQHRFRMIWHLIAFMKAQSMECIAKKRIKQFM